MIEIIKPGLEHFGAFGEPEKVGKKWAGGAQ